MAWSAERPNGDFLAMSRGAHSFKQGDLTKGFKAVVKAGARRWRIEIAEGKIPTSGAAG